jgi:hypothetical protein
MMVVCMNRIGAPKGSTNGAVDDAIGSSASRSRSTDIDGLIGPTPDDPAIVTCGGAVAASFGSNSR